MKLLSSCSARVACLPRVWSCLKFGVAMLVRNQCIGLENRFESLSRTATNVAPMNEETDTHPESRRRERLVERLEPMVESGRVTETEAARIRAAVEPKEFDDAVIDVRTRHARESLGAAVQGGQMTREDADAYLERIKKGERPKGLRSHVRKLLPFER